VTAAGGPVVDPEELGLLAETLRVAMTSTASGSALHAALAELGWREMLAEMPGVAIPLVFRLLGETGAHAPVLADVVLAAGGLSSPGGDPALPYAGGLAAR